MAAVSYRGVLERGFALVRDEAGAALRRAAAVRDGQPLRIEFADGEVAATARDGSLQVPPEAARTKRARRGRNGEGQGSLF
jgi:exodeoxyribonuclease VII large subunit